MCANVDKQPTLHLLQVISSLEAYWTESYLHMQDFPAAEFGSLPLPESISFEDDPGFELELDLRPCASLEPGDGPALPSAQYLQSSQSIELAQRNVNMPTCTVLDGWSFHSTFPSDATSSMQPIAKQKPVSAISWYKLQFHKCCWS